MNMQKVGFIRLVPQKVLKSSEGTMGRSDTTNSRTPSPRPNTGTIPGLVIEVKLRAKNPKRLLVEQINHRFWRSGGKTWS